MKKIELEKIVRKYGFKLHDIIRGKHGIMIRVEGDNHHIITLSFNVHKVEEIPIKEVESILCHKRQKVLSIFNTI